MRGYHKPIMIAGGLGNIREPHVHKRDMPAGSLLVVLGGPAMLIGLGGGAASSMTSGASDAELDFASVQRDNAEMEHRCQEVIDRCWQLGDRNPIRFIHDVGAGGLSNALPELVKDGGRGGRIELRRIPSADAGDCRRSRSGATRRRSATCWRSPRTTSTSFQAICERERCPFAVVGEALDRTGAARGRSAARRHAGGPAAVGALRQAATHAAGVRRARRPPARRCR